MVSSGAIALGRRHLNLGPAKLKLEESQAAAAVGQIRLAHAYKELLDVHEIAVAQILLTLGDTEQRRRYLNARGTINTLLGLGAVPVINENDTVATAEIRYGDNDRLAARVAQMIGADCLVLLSDIDGLYTADPKEDPDAHFIARVLEITPAIEAMAGGSAATWASGGMHTKIAAAKIAVGAGCHLCISLGSAEHPLRQHRGGRPLHVVRAHLDAGGHPQAMDCGHIEARGRHRRRRWRGSCVDGRQESAAGRRHSRTRAIRSRRHGQHHRTRRHRNRHAASAPIRTSTRRGSSAASPRISRRCWDFAAAMKSCTAMIWCCSESCERASSAH